VYPLPGLHGQVFFVANMLFESGVGGNSAILACERRAAVAGTAKTPASSCRTESVHRSRGDGDHALRLRG
jgi:hypothetical protein